MGSRYKLAIVNLENKVEGFNDEKEKELKNLEKSISTELEAEKKMAVVDMKLGLAEMKSKYAELKYKNNIIILYLLNFHSKHFQIKP